MKARLFFACILSVMLHTVIIAQPSWTWAQQAVSPNIDYGRNMAKDASGNMYVCGTFSATVTFGTITLPGSGALSMFLVKYDAAGNVIWAKTATGMQSTYANALCVDPAGYVYVTGQFTTSIDFGGVMLTGSPADIFLVKYDASGNPIWAQRAGGTNAEQGFGLAADLFGNIFMTGYFKSGPCTFGSFALANTNGSSSDYFIAKYDSSGVVEWAYKAGGNVYDEGYCVTTDASGSVYVAGFFASTSIVFGTFGLTNAGASATSDVFVAKYDSTGVVQWAYSYGGPGDDECDGIAMDSAMHLYVAGTYLSSSMQMGTNNLQNSDGSIFIAKMDTSGSVNWALCGGGTSGFMYKNSIAVDASQNVYVAGSFAGDTVFFGTDTLINTDASGSTHDFFVVKCDPAGQVDWTVTGGGTGSDDAYGVVALGNNNFVTMGSFISAAITIGATTLTNTGSYDFFITNAGSSGVPVDELIYDSAVRVFPNPCSQSITVDGQGNVSHGTSDLFLFDALGNTVRQTALIAETSLIDLNGLTPGIYFYQIINENGVSAAGRLVVQ
jgi:hypothetical protein